MKNVKILGGILIFGVLLVSSLIASAFVFETESPIKKIGSQGAVNFAWGVYQGDISEVELLIEDSRDIYVVEYSDDTEVKVDAFTGHIIGVEKEGISVDLVNARVSENQARVIAKQKIDGEIRDVETKRVDGENVYVIEMISLGDEVEVSISMMSGKILNVKQEKDVVPVTPVQKSNANIARELALNALGGGTIGDVEIEDGFVYEVEVRHNGKDYDVLVDVSNKKVIDVEED